MKKGLILEGGAMRGMYTCGVTDVLMEHNIVFDGAIGVSAGAAFGCNIKSEQPGRAIRYNKRFCKDSHFGSFISVLRCGDLYDGEFCYRKLPYELDIFDTDTYAKNPMDFYVVCTDANTGEAVYHNCMDGSFEDIQWMRASASMPVVSKTVKLDGRELLDGGIADSIPIKYFESVGYDRNVIILTQPKDFRKKPTSHMGLLKMCLRKYPAVAKLLENRHVGYNEELDYIHEKEARGEVLVIYPEKPLEIGSMTKDPNELERVYQEGRKVGEAVWQDVVKFLEG